MSNPEYAPALAKFLEMSGRLERLLGKYGTAAKAREIPARAAAVYDSAIEIRNYSSHGTEEHKAAAAAAKEVMARCKAEAFAEAERKRDAILAEVARELEQLRAALPWIVTPLVIELGVTSRQLAHEAETGSQ